MKKPMHGVIALAVLNAALGVSCGDSEGGGGGGGGSGGTPEHTGSACKEPSQCYPNLEGGSLAGEIVCMTQVSGGYCSHLCDKDEDCCKVPGECQTNIRQVCSPFESTGKKYCFLSCEDADVTNANIVSDGGVVSDGTRYCVLEANSAFGCRSTGGGVENRKVCLP